MKKVIIFLLMNLIILLVGLSILNKREFESKIETITFADPIWDITKSPSIPWTTEIPNLSNITNPIGNFLFDVESPLYETLLKPNHDVSPDPTILLNIWITPGYDLQPGDRNAIINQPKTLYTNSDRAFWVKGFLPKAEHKYIWYKSSDKINWEKMSNHEQNLTVIPNTTQTVYYKQVSYWKPDVPPPLDSIAYSQIGSIKPYSKNNDANSVKVTTDNEYLYNNQDTPVTTFVRGKIMPEEATGDIIWSVDNPSLATVDPHTGLVTVKKNEIEGIVKVTGTVTNMNRLPVQDTVSIRVGGGLEDVTVDEGEPAKFKILGGFDSKLTSVSWYKSGSQKEYKILHGENGMTYTIPNVKAADDNTKYYAVITVKNEKSGKSQTVQTRDATLHVKRKNIANVKLDSTISKKDNVSDSTTLYGVKKNDLITYKAILEAEKLDSSGVKGIISLMVPLSMELPEDGSGVKLDNMSIEGQKINDDQSKSHLFVEKVDDKMRISINNIDFSKVKRHVVEITGNFEDEIKSSGISSYKTMFQYTDQSTINGDPLTWYLGDNLVSLKANGWQYPTVNSTSKARLLRRIKMTDNALNITDNRTDKKSLQVYLKQQNPFKSGNNILAAEIRYYRKNGSFTKLDKDGVIAEETNDGETLKSIAWSPDEGPLLYIYGGDKAAGTYSTGLEWSLVQSIPNTNTPIKINS